MCACVFSRGERACLARFLKRRPLRKSACFSLSLKVVAEQSVSTARAVAALAGVPDASRARDGRARRPLAEYRGFVFENSSIAVSSFQSLSLSDLDTLSSLVGKAARPLLCTFGMIDRP